MTIDPSQTTGSADEDEYRYRYIQFRLDPGISEHLFLKKTLEDALMQSFGLSRAGMYIDILRVAENGEQVVLRVAEQDAQALLGAVVAVAKARISVVNESSVLEQVLESRSTE